MNSEFEKYSTQNAEIINKKAWLIVDSSGNIKFANDLFYNVFLLKKDDSLRNLNFEPDLPGVISKLTENNLTGFNSVFIYEVNNQIINYNIEIEKVELFNSPYFIVLFNAHEEEKIIEDKINNLHYALEYGKVPVIIIDNKGIISFATNTFEKILDFELSTIYNGHISTIFSQSLPHAKMQKLEAAIESGNEWSEAITITPSGEQPSYFELKLNPILNESNNIINFILTAHDISYYVFKNEVTAKSEKQLKSIINNISDLLIILKQSEDNILFEDGNDNFLRTFYLDKAAVLKKTFKDVLPEKLSGKIEEEISSLKQKKEFQCKFDLSLEDRCYACGIVVVDEGATKDNLLVISLKDITDEQKKKEQQRELLKKQKQLNRLKTTFLQNMSHEIRTPFTAIMGYSDIMVDCIDEGDFETVVEITHSLKSVLNRVVNLFENVLEVTDIETGDVHLDLIFMNCNQILQAIYDQKIEEVKKKNVEFEIDLDSEEYLCEIDWVKFESIITNLIENSIKYTDEGKIKISSKKEADYIAITISDTGLGINEKVISRLFESFVQEELDGHSRNYEGAGLGLTIAYEYTKLLNGQMDIKSKKNVGTEIFLNFPLKYD